MADDLARLDGKVALITGAGRSGGQGQAEARLFAEAGATVYLGDICDEEGQDVAAKIGDRATYVHLDVTDEANWARVIDDIVGTHNRLDILVNNAGLWSGPGILDTPPADYDRVIAVNQKGVYLGMRAVAEVMKKAGAGSIVNISSNAAFSTWVPYWDKTMNAFAYTTSKWAVRGMTRAAAKEFAPMGIRVNAIMPGPTDTAMLGDHGKFIAPNVPLGRLAEPDEIARVVMFVASDQCPFLTGSEIAVDAACTV